MVLLPERARLSRPSPNSDGPTDDGFGNLHAFIFPSSARLVSNIKTPMTLHSKPRFNSSSHILRMDKNRNSEWNMGQSSAEFIPSTAKVKGNPFLFVTMERMSDVLGDHFDTRPPPGCQTPKLGRVVTLYLFPPILSMGHMIFDLFAKASEDASSRYLTAGSPDLSRLREKTNSGRQHHDRAAISEPEQDWTAGRRYGYWDFVLEMASSRVRNRAQLQRHRPCRSSLYFNFKSFEQLLTSFPWQSQR